MRNSLPGGSCETSPKIVVWGWHCQHCLRHVAVVLAGYHVQPTHCPTWSVTLYELVVLCLNAAKTNKQFHTTLSQQELQGQKHALLLLNHDKPIHKGIQVALGAENATSGRFFIVKFLSSRSLFDSLFSIIYIVLHLFTISYSTFLYKNVGLILILGMHPMGVLICFHSFTGLTAIYGLYIIFYIYIIVYII